MDKGRLCYIIGPSGSGKDSILKYARDQLSNHPNIIFAHRYITRLPEIDGENHIYLSDQEFEHRYKLGLFYMCWNYNNLWYGIGEEVSLWLSRGLNVVVNGSRRYLQSNSIPSENIDVVMVQTDLQLLRNRLISRGRETPQDIEKRLDLADIQPVFDPKNTHIIENNDTIETAGNQFIQILTKS